MPTPAEAARFKRANDELSRRISTDLRKAWRALDARTPQAKRDVLLDVTPALVRQYGQVAGAIAAEYFEATTGTQATIAEPPSDEAVQGSVRALAGGLWTGRGEEAMSFITSAAVRHMLQAGRSTIYDSSARRGVRFARVPEAGACDWCRIMSSRGAVYLSRESAGGEGNEYHDACVVGGTVVSGPPARRGLRRKYEGEIVTLVTAMGRELTITPNHPVLTDRGWVPAGLLKEGDNLVGSPRVDGQIVRGPDEDHRPARIEDFVRALGVVFPSVRRGMPVSAEEFHGDGFDSEVDVVTVDDLLRNELDATLTEPVSELELEMAPFAFSALELSEHGLGARTAGLPGLGDSPLSGVGGSGVSLPFLGRECGHPNLSLLRCGPLADTQLAEPPGYDSPGHSISLREVQDRFTLGVPVGEVHGDRLPSVRSVEVGRKFDPQSLYTAHDGLLVYAKLGGDLRHRLGGLVTLDRLVDKRVGEFSGHVYNLETVEGWYSANGITVSNCSCQPTAVKDGDDLPYDAEALYAEYKDAWDAAGGTGVDAGAVAQAMRRLRSTT